MQFLKRVYLLPLRLLAWGIGIYQANRERLRVFMERPRARLVFKALIMLTLIVWLLVGLVTWNSGTDALGDFIRQQMEWLKQP